MNPGVSGMGFDTPEFDTAKSDGSLASNMNRAPVMSVDGIVIGQSRAIEAYAAERSGLFGSSNLERAQIQNVVENVKDIKEKWGKCLYGLNDEGTAFISHVYLSCLFN